jgi:N-acetylglucosaminyl-diphospho-decaprenol L-rhamnosyltransferase
MTAGPPALEVVIVSYGAPDLLRACLASLRRWSPRAWPMLVHVVDNAGPDGSADLVAREFPEVRLHRLAQNTGFSAANNVALRRVSAPYVLVLNPDTELREGVLEHLLGLMAERPEVGIAGCRLERRDGTFDHAAKRSFPTPAAALAHFAGIGPRARGGALTQYRATDLGEYDVGDVDAVNGAFMLVRRAAMAQVGLLDEGYWLYMEDLDWCARFWQRGWRVVYDGRVTALHVKGGSAGQHRALKANIHFHRGMGRFYRRHRAGRNLPLDLAVYAAIGGKLAFSVVRSALARARR